MTIPGNPGRSEQPVMGPSVPVPVSAQARAIPGRMSAAASPAQVAGQQPGADGARPASFERVARLATAALGRPLASVTVIEGIYSTERIWAAAPALINSPSPVERSLCQFVIDSGNKLIINDVTVDLPVRFRQPGELAGLMAWAGFPVRDPAGRAVGALCVADVRPRPWTAYDLQVLADLAQVASSEVALRIAIRRGADRALLARTLQQLLLPPRLPKIPGLQVAARYHAGGSGAEILGDFYDVFPSVRGSWGLVVGDVCGKGIAAAKSTALARYALRGEAVRQARPSLILAGLNQTLLDWPTDDPRFLSAIYATVRPRLGVTSVRISSAGHPLALIRRADGRVQEVGQPGTLLGVFPDPDLHDTRQLLRAGDSMILFTDGVTEARSHVDRDFYGDKRLSELIGALGNVSAARIASAIVKATRAFSGGVVADDTAVLVLKVL